ncbi:hypothetical protein LguiA_029471 [Lonicera macranthoides]
MKDRLNKLHLFYYEIVKKEVIKSFGEKVIERQGGGFSGSFLLHDNSENANNANNVVRRQDTRDGKNVIVECMSNLHVRIEFEERNFVVSSLNKKWSDVLEYKFELEEFDEDNDDKYVSQSVIEEGVKYPKQPLGIDIPLSYKELAHLGQHKPKALISTILGQVPTERDKSLHKVSQRGESLRKASQKGESLGMSSQRGESAHKVSRRGKSLRMSSQRGKSLHKISQRGKSFHKVSQRGEELHMSSQRGQKKKSKRHLNKKLQELLEAAGTENRALDTLVQSNNTEQLRAALATACKGFLKQFLTKPGFGSYYFLTVLQLYPGVRGSPSKYSQWPRQNQGQGGGLEIVFNQQLTRLGQWFKSISEEALLTQAQALTFIVIDQCLGANMGFAKGPTGLSKYFMTSPIGEVIFGGDTMRFSNKKGTEKLKGKSKGSHALITQV